MCAFYIACDRSKQLYTGLGVHRCAMNAAIPSFVVDHNTLLENIEICTGIAFTKSVDWPQVYHTFDRCRDTNNNVERFVKFFNTKARKSLLTTAPQDEHQTFCNLCMPVDACLFATVVHYYFGF